MLDSTMPAVAHLNARSDAAAREFREALARMQQQRERRQHQRLVAVERRHSTTTE